MDLFNVVFSHRGAIRNRHRYGGGKSLHFDKFTILSLLFLPPYSDPFEVVSKRLSSELCGQTPLPTSMGGGMAGFAPFCILHWLRIQSCISIQLGIKFAELVAAQITKPIKRFFHLLSLVSMATEFGTFRRQIF